MKKHRLFPTVVPALTVCSLLISVSARASASDGNFEKVETMMDMPSPISHAGSMVEDMALVGERLRQSLLAGFNAKTVPAAEAALTTLRQDGSWADQDYADVNREQWKAASHLPRLLTIARAFYQPDSPLSQRPEIKAKIQTSLDYWLRVDPHNDNWWHNEIGVPQQIGELLILMGDDASEATRLRGTTLMTRSKMDKMTGQNLVWTAQIQIMRGCLAQAPDLVEAAYTRMWQEVRYADAGQEGIQVDASFHQHGALLYSGGYGMGFTQDVTRFVSYARGTHFALPAAKQAILEAYVLDGQQWMLRNGMWDFGVIGRELIRPGKSAAGLVVPVTTLAQVAGPRQKEMIAFAARMQGKTNAVPLSGNRHYWLSDYMAHQRPGYFATTRMYSTRTLNTDGFINGENKKSHHVADGAMYLSQDGQEFVGIYPVWDWHCIPGTTVEQNTPLEPTRVNHRGTTRFVGGVSDGIYGCAAMYLATGELHARKSWFYFDDEIVCLGAGITCPTSNSVFTSLNQTLLKGPVKTSLDAGAELPSGDRDLKGVTWVWHAGMGYVFPTPTTAHIGNHAQTGSLRDIGPASPDPISKAVFSLWLDHGVGVHDGSYAYIVLPASDATQTADKARQSSVEILSNTPSLQSVWHKKLELLAAAFYQPGQAHSAGTVVSVDTPCLLLLQQTGNKVRLSVSNPQNEPLTVKITLNMPLQGDAVAHMDQGKSQVTIQLPGGLEAGRSVFREWTLSH